MPLVDRADSALVVVDVQPGFFEHSSMSDDEQAQAAATLARAVWLAGIAMLLDVPAVVVEEGPQRNGGTAIDLHDLGYRAVVPEDATYSTGALEHRRGLGRMSQAGVELNHCKGVTFEWLHTVDDAIQTLREAAARFGPPPLRL